MYSVHVLCVYFCPQINESSGVYSLEPDPDKPVDENLVCDKCGKQYKEGEIQKFKLHYTKCQSNVRKDDIR